MHPASPVGIQRLPARRLRVRPDGPHPARRGVIQLHRLSGNRRRPQVPRVQELPQRPAVHGAHPAVEQPGPVQLAQDRRDAARPVHVLQVVGAARRDLAQARHPAGQLVDLLEPEVHPGLVRRGEQVQDRVRRPAHRHVQRHRVLERVPAGDRPRQHRRVAVGVVLPGDLRDQGARPLEQPAARRVRGQRAPVARQGQADRLGQAVHRVGREHARARTARRAGGFLHGQQLLVGHRRIRRGHHRVDQVQLAAGDAGKPRGRAGLHRPAGHEHGRDVQPHGGDQHARRDLVAVRDADHGVRAVRVHHVLHRVGDQLAARQRVQHAAVPHGDAVVHRDRVELARDRPGRPHCRSHHLADLTQVHVPGDELGEAVCDGDDRLADVFPGDPGGAQQGARACHVPAVRNRTGPKRRHGDLLSAESWS